MANPAYLTGLDRNRANYTPLNPVTFLERAAAVHPDRPRRRAWGATRYTWRGDLRRAAVGSPRRWRGAASAAATRSR